MVPEVSRMWVPSEVLLQVGEVDQKKFCGSTLFTLKLKFPSHHVVPLQKFQQVGKHLEVSSLGKVLEVCEAMCAVKNSKFQNVKCKFTTFAKMGSGLKLP